MEQRCPNPGGGGACKEEGKGSCTCQADSGFEIRRTGLEKQSVYSTGEGHQPGARGTCREKRLERVCFTQVLPVTLHCRIPSSGSACSESLVDSGEGMYCTMGLVSLEVSLVLSLIANTIFPKELMGGYLFPSRSSAMTCYVQDGVKRAVAGGVKLCRNLESRHGMTAAGL